MIRIIPGAFLLSGFLVGGLLHGNSEARFDARFLTPDFEGNWAQIEVQPEGAPAPHGAPAQAASARRGVVAAEKLAAAEIAILQEAAAQRSETPEFAMSSILPSGEAVVFGVTENKAADIVILDNGLDQGFRVGMVCEIIRQERLIGTIILVAVEADRAAGLIINLQPDNTITFGDVARIKTVQFS